MVIGAGGWPLMTTAGRRPFSMRVMRAAVAGSVADCWETDVGPERLLAASLGEKREALAAAIAKSAKAAVTSARVFVDDFMGDLMGRNRITFEGLEIRLVG